MSHAVVASLLSASLFSPLLVAAQGTSTLQGFEAVFRRANASKDFRALEQLVWWAHAKPKACEDMRGVLRQEFGHPIPRIDTRPFSWANALDNSAITAFRTWTWRPRKWREIDIHVGFRIRNSETPLRPGSVRLPPH
jgi:hypothetical protein